MVNGHLAMFSSHLTMLKCHLATIKSLGNGQLSLDSGQIISVTCQQSHVTCQQFLVFRCRICYLGTCHLSLVISHKNMLICHYLCICHFCHIPHVVTSHLSCVSHMSISHKKHVALSQVSCHQKCHCFDTICTGRFKSNPSFT